VYYTVSLTNPIEQPGFQQDKEIRPYNPGSQESELATCKTANQVQDLPDVLQGGS
jgi:hypothetical protein